MIQRSNYLDDLISFKDTKLIKVITGVRRCGKSTLFQLYQQYLLANGIVKDQIISINLEDLDLQELTNHKELHSYILKHQHQTKKTYIFIDEVQNCDQFERAINSLLLRENLDIYITGSNAYILSGELATFLSGRYVTIQMLPLSFSEYMSVQTNSSISTDDSFMHYLQVGSFPYLANQTKIDSTSISYIESIFSTILIKDIAKREGITDISLLESIIKTVASAVGSPISTKKISDTINAQGRRCSIHTVDHYLKTLCDAYVFYKVDRYDIKGRQYLKTLGKYYLVDTGLRSILLSSQSLDLGHLIGNIVYLELKRRHLKVYIGKLADKEVDFVATNAEGIEYYQVAATVLDPNTLSRELSPLEHIQDHFPKYLITLDKFPANTHYNGIRHLNLIHWLLEKQ